MTQAWNLFIDWLLALQELEWPRYDGSIPLRWPVQLESPEFRHVFGQAAKLRWTDEYQHSGDATNWKPQSHLNI
jgi:hypothetical protein